MGDKVVLTVRTNGIESGLFEKDVDTLLDKEISH
jgi:hypothetical protein